MQETKIIVLIAFACIALILWKYGEINPARYFSEILRDIYEKCDDFFDFSSRKNAISMVAILALIILLTSIVLGKLFKF